MKNLTYWAAVHAAHWGLLYGAFVANVEGAMYVLKFFTWVLASFSMFLLADKAAQDAAKKPAQPVRHALSMLQAWVMLLSFVWFGHIAAGLAWGWTMVMITIHGEAVKKARASYTAEQPMHHPV